MTKWGDYLVDSTCNSENHPLNEKLIFFTYRVHPSYTRVVFGVSYLWHWLICLFMTLQHRKATTIKSVTAVTSVKMRCSSALRFVKTKTDKPSTFGFHLYNYRLMNCDIWLYLDWILIWETGKRVDEEVFMWGALLSWKWLQTMEKAIWWTTRSSTLQYLEIQLYSWFMLACKAWNAMWYFSVLAAI